MVVILVSLPSSKIGSSTAEVGLSILSFSAFLQGDRKTTWCHDISFHWNVYISSIETLAKHTHTREQHTDTWLGRHRVRAERVHTRTCIARTQSRPSHIPPHQIVRYQLAWWLEISAARHICAHTCRKDGPYDMIPVCVCECVCVFQFVFVCVKPSRSRSLSHTIKCFTELNLIGYRARHALRNT